MADLVRPTLAVGDNIKIYRSPIYGRENARVTAINNSTGVAEVRTLAGNVRITSIRWRQAAVDGQIYWTELPAGWAP